MKILLNKKDETIEYLRNQVIYLKKIFYIKEKNIQKNLVNYMILIINIVYN